MCSCSDTNVPVEVDSIADTYPAEVTDEAGSVEPHDALAASNEVRLLDQLSAYPPAVALDILLGCLRSSNRQAGSALPVKYCLASRVRTYLPGNTLVAAERELDASMSLDLGVAANCIETAITHSDPTEMKWTDWICANAYVGRVDNGARCWRHRHCLSAFCDRGTKSETVDAAYPCPGICGKMTKIDCNGTKSRKWDAAQQRCLVRSPNKQGAECNLQYGCSGGFDCQLVFDGTHGVATAQCVAPAVEGDSCQAAGAHCGTGLFCHPGLKKCTRRKMTGDTCERSADFGVDAASQCELGDDCVRVGTTFRCLRLVKRGNGCIDTAQCERYDDACSITDTGQRACRQLPFAEGQPCLPADIPAGKLRGCAAPHVCDRVSLACRPAPSAGEPCAVFDDGPISGCAMDSACRDGACVAPLSLGATCSTESIDSFCAEGTVCVGDKCATMQCLAN